MLVGTAGGEVIYLSCEGGESRPDETLAVMDTAGWVMVDTGLSRWEGTRHLIVRPAETIDEHPPPVQPAATLGHSHASQDEESVRALKERIRADLRIQRCWFRRNWPVQAEDALASGDSCMT
ncbi:hypothetical protein [Deinococcus sp. 6GRE01]|uniref:hypothetical protein n=1 Tax=Deinococcus sp. 6GRE01 TaxID=2745873 RepID=UPI001E4DBA7F|nr:hypothetical protein [Deinococcus sp. 6GRE01]MCD0155825.1 hypothetical protein [Deinococcus sp. 6GRE01]